MSTERTRRHPSFFTGVLLPFVLLTGAMIGLGLLVTHLLVHHWPFTIEDRAVLDFVAERTPFWNRDSDLVSLSAYTVGLGVTLIVAGAVMRLAYHRWRESLFLLAALVSQTVVFKITALIVARPRPAVPQLDDFPPGQSFPSGHVAAAVALYGGIALVLALHARRKAHAAAWWVLFLIIPVAVGVSRVYRGMHHPSDAVASFLLGLGCLGILRRAMLTPARPVGVAVP